MELSPHAKAFFNKDIRKPFAKIKDIPSDKTSLELSCVGNCTCSALIDQKGTVVWFCLPRFDGDPVFCSLLKTNTGSSSDTGFFDIRLDQLDHVKQEYVGNTPVLRTRLYDLQGACLEIIDFIPKFQNYDRNYRPNMFIRIVKPISNRPRAQIRLRPTFGYGWGSPEKTRGSNHIRYVLSNFTIRLTTNAPISYILDEVLFEVEETIYMVLMPDESLRDSLDDMCVNNLNKTVSYWKDWTKVLSIPFEWQEEVIRAAITLKLCEFEESGAFVSAMTSSIPHYPGGTSSDGRYCWPRDSIWVTHGLNQLGDTKSLEQYLGFICNIVASFNRKDEEASRIKPVYSVSLETRLYERIVHRLPGFRGLGPVHIGHTDCETMQTDVYGALIMCLSYGFWDKRLDVQGDHVLFDKLENLGKEALKLFDKPCHFVRKRPEETRLHTFPVMMTFAACDRLAKVASFLGKEDKQEFWQMEAERLRAEILTCAWNPSLKSFVNTFGGNSVDAYLLMLPQLRVIDHSHPKFLSTLELMEKRLKTNRWMRCFEEDNHAIIGATLEYILVLWELGRQEEAKSLFDHVLSSRNKSGLLGESVDPETNELWGNFPSSNAMIGIISVANRLSKRWELVLSPEEGKKAANNVSVTVTSSQ